MAKKRAKTKPVLDLGHVQLLYLAAIMNAWQTLDKEVAPKDCLALLRMTKAVIGALDDV